MSHFTVAIVCEDPDYLNDILEPYREYDGDASFPEEFLEFEDHTQEALESFEEYSKNLDKWSARESFEDFTKNNYTINQEDENSELLPHECRWGYYNNPQSKWDWWQVGGRWNGLIHTLDGNDTNYAQIKDIDFTPDKAKYNEAIKFWEIIVEGRDLLEGEERPFSMWNSEYYINQYKTKEKYAESHAKFATWALIDKDGNWYEKGEMGWFGVSDASLESRESYDEVFERILKEANPEDYLVIVDCHI